MKIDKYKVVLASKSPRRRELLGKIIDNFDIITADVDESFAEEVHPREAVEFLAIRKGAPVSSLCGEDTVVISSDTLVELGGIPLGKPRSEKDAFAMLKSLSGRTHNVHTGVAVSLNGRTVSGVSTSSVSFRELSDEEISDYISTGEPMDKAGSYGIQGEGGRLVSGYDGDFDTIVGLPLKLTELLLKELVDEVEND